MPISATSAKPAQKLMSADDALARILGAVPALPAVEVPLLDALGRVLVDDIAAGGFPDREVEAGEAMQIMTGAPMPDGADTVVRVEDTDNASDVVTIAAATQRGTATRQAGEDLRKGETILTKGTVLRAAEIGLLASDGRARIRVRKRPRVAVFSTGDEIVELDAPLERGQIRDSNRYTLASAIRAAGAEL